MTQLREQRVHYSEIIGRLKAAARGWNREPTPIVWGGKLPALAQELALLLPGAVHRAFWSMNARRLDA